MSTDDVCNAITKEASRIEEDSLYSAKGHFEAASWWSKSHLWLGVPTAIIAGVSGVSALKDWPILAGSLAILAAALASVTTFLNPSERAAAHHSAGSKFRSLQNRVRMFREIDLSRGPITKELTDHIKRFGAERDDLNEASPQIPRRAFERARKGIESGEASYDADNA